MCARLKQPFEYRTLKEFNKKLPEWVGDVLYDILPEKGYEERDEQIYTAFQIADAFADKTVHLAEAGLGTGKTFAYLLSAIPYARMTGKPVVIACATSALQEQLASATGDIETLSKLLDLEVDARMAKDSRQYVCDVRVEENVVDFGDQHEEMNQWLLQTKMGERSEMPDISDRIWKKISWNEFVSCDNCLNRGYCKLMAARKHYREAVDLVIVDHATFFRDLWSRQERMADGKLPILPNYSAVILDEGHKILLPASLEAGHRINKEEIDEILHTLEQIQDARPSLIRSTIAAGNAEILFFKKLKSALAASESSRRLAVKRNKEMVQAAADFHNSLEQLLMEFQIEQELYMDTLTPTQIQAYEGQIERAAIALSHFLRSGDHEFISWVDKKDASFWVVPRNVGKMLEKQLYQRKIPVIFTSATLSNNGNFDYFGRTVGLDNPSKSTVGSTFHMEEQAVVHMAEKGEKQSLESKVEYLVELLKKKDGHALVLTNSIKEIRRIRKCLESYELPFEILWEDKGERGHLVQRFREEESSVLVGSDFWEGIDVPGDALTLVVIWQLPFPEIDPLIEVQRKEVKMQGLDPVTQVDYPEMGLKLKQGCGRLIRTKTDKGDIVIMENVKGKPWEQVVLDAVPKGARVKWEA
ncbi:ATP-dependent DNA helicase [[Clostridium] polysaccharolyticum]|uniref:ATP-dependent DNA helicase DinG n=1 Tax=[Clostridium] polysaccharolyticum TaxID=29364 RepID=A0A1I0DFY3_9FIRM|nr:ATP-dependent DNA helicase [[Clostridium] polysaccharolyticum]SET30996.1 ATP-dependent DNA helicase DinG [[Clostridium] polysaccharolyticum]